MVGERGSELCEECDIECSVVEGLCGGCSDAWILVEE